MEIVVCVCVCGTHACVQIHYRIIQLARHWELETFWMIDDSVPTSMLYQKTLGNQEGDPILRFDRVLETIESMPSQDCFSNAVLIGLTSTFSTPPEAKRGEVCN